jgi:hypothetical protein
MVEIELNKLKLFPGHYQLIEPGEYEGSIKIRSTLNESAPEQEELWEKIHQLEKELLKTQSHS